MANSVPTTWRNEIEHRRLLADSINGASNGNTRNAGSVTLTASTATTVVTDVRCGIDSVVLFMAKTANAAAEMNGMYVSARGKETFTITHANNSQTDRDFEYALLGTGRGT